MLAELSVALLCGFNVTVVHPDTSAPQFQVKVHHAPKAKPVESMVKDILMNKDVPPAPPKEQPLKEIEKPKQPVAHYRPWYEVYGGEKHPTSKGHLMSVHGYTKKQLDGKSQAELDELHGKAHNERPRYMASAPPKSYPLSQSSGNCPNGQCPLQRRRR